jgi:hypothetical protein
MFIDSVYHIADLKLELSESPTWLLIVDIIDTALHQAITLLENIQYENRLQPTRVKQNVSLPPSTFPMASASLPQSSQSPHPIVRLRQGP